MSMPNISDLQQNINVSRDQAINIILTSIGMEELSLAHIINSEAEKIQFSLGTLETANNKTAEIDQIIEINNSSNKMLRDVIKSQMLLGMKMEDLSYLLEKQPSVYNFIIDATVNFKMGNSNYLFSIT